MTLRAAAGDHLQENSHGEVGVYSGILIERLQCSFSILEV